MVEATITFRLNRKKVKAFTRRQRNTLRRTLLREARADAKAADLREQGLERRSARKLAVFEGYTEKTPQGRVFHPGADPARTLALIGEEY